MMRRVSDTTACNNDGMRRWLITGWVVVGLIFGVGGAWAWFARISGAVIAPAQVTREGGVRTVQHPDGGVVKDILVRESDAVQKGQVLLVLEDKELRAQLTVTRNKLDNVLADIARLEAERDDADEVLFPVELEKRAETNTQIKDLLRMQRALFMSRKRARKGQKEIYEKRIEAHRKAIAGLKARLQASKLQSSYIADEIKTVADLLAKGQARRPRLLALQREAARLEGEQGSLLQEIASRKEEIARLSREFLQEQKKFLAQVMEALVKRKEEVADLQEKLSVLKQKLDRIEIRAPISGHVFNLMVRTIGGVIKPATPILQIMPNDEPLMIEANVRPVDIDEIHQQQPVWIYFSSYASDDIPKLQGRVRAVSPAPLMDVKGEQPYYRVEIEVSAKELAKLGRSRPVVPGMPVEAFITTRARRPFDLFFTDVLLPRMRRALRSD